MSLQRELVNTASTLAAVKFTNIAFDKVAPKNMVTFVARPVVTLAVAYAANNLANGQSPDEIQAKIQDKVVKSLVETGLSDQEAVNAFAQHYTLDENLKPSVLKNIGNVVTTVTGGALGSFPGMLATTALCTTMGRGLDHMMSAGNHYASHGFGIGALVGPTVGEFAGAYIGNKIFQNVAEKRLDTQSQDIVSKILAERMTQPESFSQRLEAQEASKAEVITRG